MTRTWLNHKDESFGATCISGDVCDERAVESPIFPGKFRHCLRHQTQLDHLRELVQAEAYSVSSRNKEHVKDRYCEEPGCSNRPMYGGSYCTMHMGGD